MNVVKFLLVIILDQLIISDKSWSFQCIYRFCLYSLLPRSILMLTVSLLPGVVYVMPNLSKKFSIHFSSSSLNSFFFLLDFLCTAVRRLNFLARVPITLNFFRGLERNDLSVLC